MSKRGQLADFVITKAFDRYEDFCAEVDLKHGVMYGVFPDTLLGPDVNLGFRLYGIARDGRLITFTRKEYVQAYNREMLDKIIASWVAEYAQPLNAKPGFYFPSRIRLVREATL